MLNSKIYPVTTTKGDTESIKEDVKKKETIIVEKKGNHHRKNKERKKGKLERGYDIQKGHTLHTEAEPHALRHQGPRTTDQALWKEEAHETETGRTPQTGSKREGECVEGKIQRNTFNAHSLTLPLTRSPSLCAPHALSHTDYRHHSFIHLSSSS